MKTHLAAPLCAALLVGSAPCQSDPSPAPATAAITRSAETGSFMLEAGSHEIPDLIDGVAAYLDFNILYVAQELQGAGKIRVTRHTEVDKDGCWELFGALLYHKGLAVVALDPRQGFYEVIAINGPRSREISSGAMFVPCTEIEAYANQRATPILTTVQLHNINATIANNALRPFFASTGSNMTGLTLGNVGNNSDMLLQGFGPQVAAAYRLLKLIDVGGDGSNSLIQVVRLQHAAAEELVARIEETFGVRAAMQANVQGMPAGATLRAVAHPPQNAVILSGSATQIREAMELIATLDTPKLTPGQDAGDLLQRVKQLEERVQRLERALRGPK